MERLTRKETIVVRGKEMASVSYTHLDVYKRQAYKKMRQEIKEDKKK